MVLPRFPRFMMVPLALSNNIAPSLSVSLALPVFRVKKRSISYPGYSFLPRMPIFFALTTVLFPIYPLSLFLPHPSPLPFCHTTAYIRIQASLSFARRPVSLSRSLFPGARCLDRGPRSSLPLSLTRLISPAFPRHLPRAILPPSTRLAHPAVVSLRYSPFCPRGTSNAEAQVCKMAAARWSPVRRGHCFALTRMREM